MPRWQSGDQILVLEGGATVKVEAVHEGGMGVVYVGRLVTASGSGPAIRVALKTFHDSLVFDPVINAMLEHEHSIWALLTGVPFVLPLLGVHEIDGKPHFMMPAAEADESGCVSVAQVIQRHGEVAPRGCLAVALCVSIAMDQATERLPGLVHGDIKPGNILFVRSIPWLADFGLAAVAKQAGRSGTPQYMAPELSRSESVRTAATDIYAFGITLREMLGASNERLAFVGHLRSLATACTGFLASDRPAGFKEVVGTLTKIGLNFDPDTTLYVLHAAGGIKNAAKEHQSKLLSVRLADLIRSRRIEAAVQVLQEVPDDEIDAESLLLAGSTWSLAGDDVKALQYFERYLAAGPGDEDRLRCQSEIGLSLRRLGRLEEARRHYEELLPRTVSTPKLETMVRGNYAGVLVDLGDFETAQRELSFLLKRDAESHVIRALYAQALAGAGRFAEALDMSRAAVALEPRNGAYHVMCADYLFHLRRLPEAMESVDAAYGLGYHSREWLVLALAVNIALGRKQDAAGLFEGIQSTLPEKERDSLAAAAVDRLKVLLDEYPKGERSEPESRPPVEVKQPATARASLESREEYDPGAYRGEIREGRRGHVQIRLSAVDGSYAIDFYLGVAHPSYVEKFREGYSEVKARVQAMGFGDERSNEYRFAECQSCRFTVFTSRDEGEIYQCQACDERGPVTTTTSEKLAALAGDCSQAIGRESESSEEGKALIVGFWSERSEQLLTISNRMRADGYSEVVSKTLVFTLLATEVGKRGHAFGVPDQVWYRTMGANERYSASETPWPLDRALRELRRETGDVRSASLALPSDYAKYCLASDAERLALMRVQVEQNPESLDLREIAVSEELASGSADEAKRIAAEMKHTSPDDPRTLVANALVQIHAESFEEAVPLLERAVDRQPLNYKARMSLIAALSRLGEHEKAAAHYRKLVAFGFPIPSSAL